MKKQFEDCVFDEVMLLSLLGIAVSFVYAASVETVAAMIAIAFILGFAVLAYVLAQIHYWWNNRSH